MTLDQPRGQVGIVTLPAVIHSVADGTGAVLASSMPAAGPSAAAEKVPGWRGGPGLESRSGQLLGLRVSVSGTPLHWVRHVFSGGVLPGLGVGRVCQDEGGLWLWSSLELTI